MDTLMKISKSDLGWVAAVLDLKGGVSRKANKKRRTPQIVLHVDTTDRRIAVRLSRLTGTAPEEKEMRAPGPFLRRGCKEHCLEPHIHVEDNHVWNTHDSTRWSITGVAMAIVLSNLAPYMSTYGEYEGFVEEIITQMKAEGQGSGMVRAATLRLQELGWDIPKRISNRLRLAA